MRNRRIPLAILVAALLGALVAAPAPGVAAADPPHPDPAFLEPVPGAKCVAETPYERHQYDNSERYGAACKRIRFTYGPIHVKPGQNDVALEPVDIEQPRYDGYIVRFKPDLVRASDGGKPNTEDLHLHHATWLNLSGAYGDGPFFAAGRRRPSPTSPAATG